MIGERFVREKICSPHNNFRLSSFTIFINTLEKIFIRRIEVLRVVVVSWSFLVWCRQRALQKNCSCNTFIGKNWWYLWLRNKWFLGFADIFIAARHACFVLQLKNAMCNIILQSQQRQENYMTLIRWYPHSLLIQVFIRQPAPQHHDQKSSWARKL